MIGEFLYAFNRYLLLSLLGGLIIGSLYLCGQLILKRNQPFIRYVTVYLFSIYIIAVLYVTGMTELNLADLGGIGISPNLIPIIGSVKDFVQSGFYVVPQMLLNIILYVPFGFFMSFLIKDTKSNFFFKVIGFTLFCSISIETIQFFTGRYADIDDVILNSIGSFIGYVISLPILKLFVEKKIPLFAKYYE